MGIHTVVVQIIPGFENSSDSFFFFLGKDSSFDSEGKIEKKEVIL